MFPWVALHLNLIGGLIINLGIYTHEPKLSEPLFQQKELAFLGGDLRR